MGIDVLVRSELEKALDYHVVWLNYIKIKEITEDDLKSMIEQILRKNKLWNKYQPLIKSYNFEITFPLDLRFTHFQQIKYNIILNDNSNAINLILDLKVQVKKTC